MDEANLGLKLEGRKAMAKLLNRVLADEFLLYTKTRNYHWNVTGPQFSELHKFLDEQYNALNQIVDDVAERVRGVGGRALGSLQGFLAATRLTEPDDSPRGHRDMLADLLNDHEALVRGIRLDLDACDEHGDEGTKNFLTDRMERHEKMAWMLRAFLAGPPEATPGGLERQTKPRILTSRGRTAPHPSGTTHRRRQATVSRAAVSRAKDAV